MLPLYTHFHYCIMRAEALAGLGYILHGIPTMSIAPIFTAVLYQDVNPGWFAYAWFIVFLTAFLAIGCSVPSAGLFFGNLSFCISRKKRTFPGQVEWYDSADRNVPAEDEMPMAAPGGIALASQANLESPASSSSTFGISPIGTTQPPIFRQNSARYYSQNPIPTPARTKTWTIAEENASRSGSPVQRNASPALSSVKGFEAVPGESPVDMQSSAWMRSDQNSPRVSIQAPLPKQLKPQRRPLSHLYRGTVLRPVVTNFEPEGEKIEERMRACPRRGSVLL
jgi:hypothetical protein